jgi:hypothetical protein
MKIIQDIRDRFGNYTELNNTFVGTPPYPMIVLDNFLPKSLLLSLKKSVIPFRINIGQSSHVVAVT